MTRGPFVLSGVIESSIGLTVSNNIPVYSKFDCSSPNGPTSVLIFSLSLSPYRLILSLALSMSVTLSSLF